MTDLNFPPPWTLGQSVRGALPEAGWRAALATIGARHGIAGDASPFASGSDVVWAVGQHVVKLSTPHWRGEIDAEVEALEAVAGRLPVQTPEVVARGELAGWPYLVMTRVAGRPIGAVWPELDAPARLRFAARLGEALAALHALPPPADDGWDAFLADNVAQMPARQAARDVDPARVAEAARWLAELDPAPAPPVRLHTEVLHEHVLVDDDGLPCAMIDFADGRAGHPDYEWAAAIEMIFSGDLAAVRRCLAAYGRAFEPEVLFRWALAHRFLHLGRMARYAGEPPELIDVARRLFGVA